MRIIIRHMVPSFSSHLIAVLTLRVPEMILAETSLSFLGLGLREPVISWGVLLTGVQNIRAVALAPWLFLPGWRSWSPCWRSTSSATACATPPTPMRSRPASARCLHIVGARPSGARRRLPLSQ